MFGAFQTLNLGGSGGIPIMTRGQGDSQMNFHQKHSKFFSAVGKNIDSIVDKLCKKTIMSFDTRKYEDMLKCLAKLDDSDNSSFHIYDTALIYDEDDNGTDQVRDDAVDVFMNKKKLDPKRNYQKMLELIQADTEHFEILKADKFARIKYKPSNIVFNFKELKAEGDIFVLELLKQFAKLQPEFLKLVRFHQYWYKNVFSKELPLTNRMIAVIVTLIMQKFNSLPAVHWYCRNQKETLFTGNVRAGVACNMRNFKDYNEKIYDFIYAVMDLCKDIFFPWEGRILPRHQMNDSGKYENRLIIYDFFTEKGDKIAGRNLAEDLDDVAWVRLRKYLGCSIFAFKYMAKTS